MILWAVCLLPATLDCVIPLQGVGGVMELGLSSVRRMQFSYFPVLPLGGAVCNFQYWKLASDVQRHLLFD